MNWFVILRNFVLNPEKTLFYISQKHPRLFTDKYFLKLCFKQLMGKKLNLASPQTYNEKLQWLKLYDRNPLYTVLVDKYEVKEFVSSTIGAEYIVPTLNVYDSVDEIELERLPQQFVLKCTHDSGGVVICKNKDDFNFDDAKEKLNKSLKQNYFYNYREWPYKNVKPRIIAEKYMEGLDGDLRDYKFFCFNGIPKLMFVASERQDKQVETKFDFYDMNFHHLSISNGHPNSNTHIEKPVNFDTMIKLTAKLSAGIPHVRVDFYEVGNCVYFGEMTFYHWSVFTPFEPEKWDAIMGEWLTLPNRVIR